jgi:hypothetical protein|tara:strand:+ start:8124 stop:8672 length:549 start_codon:yes stop_codon:yes gene_type:complete
MSHYINTLKYWNNIMTDYLKTANEALKSLENGANKIEKLKSDFVSVQDTLLKAAQEAEAQGVNVHKFKREVCAENGLAYKYYDAKTDTMVPVLGKEAHQSFKNVMTALKNGYNHLDGSLKDYGSYKEMVERSKPVDPNHDFKQATSQLTKAVKDSDDPVMKARILEGIQRLISTINQEAKAA